MVSARQSILGCIFILIQQKSADYNGVMGGFANLSHIDINFSNKFMTELGKMLPGFKYNEVLDCGAGIGRISKDLLSRLFKTVAHK
jgi:protein N-terminal methyltransferase